MIKETYLGDGVYVSDDGVQFRLRTNRGERDHIIYLSGSELQTFFDFIEAKRAVKVTLEAVPHAQTKTEEMA